MAVPSRYVLLSGPPAEADSWMPRTKATPSRDVRCTSSPNVSWVRPQLQGVVMILCEWGVASPNTDSGPRARVFKTGCVPRIADNVDNWRVVCYGKAVVGVSRVCGNVVVVLAAAFQGNCPARGLLQLDVKGCGGSQNTATVGMRIGLTYSGVPNALLSENMETKTHLQHGQH